MRAKKREKVEITITFNKEEALWLKNLCQNFLPDLCSVIEAVDWKYRKQLWDLLDREGI